MAKLTDVAILGATPAGLAAAIALARAKRSVTVIEAPASAAECSLIDWAPKDVFAGAKYLHPVLKAAGAESFSKLTFHNAALDASAHWSGGRLAGYTFAAGKLIDAMTAAAKKLKVRLVKADHWPRLDLREQQVTVACNRREVEARGLLIAMNRPAEVISELALPVRNVPVSTLSATAMQLIWTPTKAARQFGNRVQILDLPERNDLGMILSAGSAVQLRVVSESTEPTNRAGQLAELLGRLREAGVIPEDVPAEGVKATQWHPPGGVALDLETHVAKRTLLIGTAGGFAGMMTGQTIAPSVRSALLAAEVMHEALDADQPQTVLGTFKQLWRQALAEYLRPPNTSLHLLLPLVFMNKQMAGRFARAMLYGEDV